MTTALDVLVVPHTHWDREWYHEVGRFRQRLVALVDELLADTAPDAQAPRDAPSPFLLDGQAVVLEDYLAVRPDQRDALAAALRARRIEAGPWYVLADELLSPGEALVRNLLAGRRVLRALGAEPPAVLYSPDAFGHAGAMPTLGVGFGLSVAVAWRGYGGARWPAGDAVWWRAADGSRVLLLHLPPDGYEFGSRLPTDAAGARERWEQLQSVLEPRARLGFVLVQNGADHHARQESWAEAIAALREAAAPRRVLVCTLAEVSARAMSDASGVQLPEVVGELRDSYGYTWTLQGTFGTRAAQKRRVVQSTRTLVRDVEPWLALLRLQGVAGDERRSALLRAAWQPLLRCLPHDTLCGCSIDAVARAMDARLDDADAQSIGMRADALDALVGHDAVEARSRRDAWRPWLLVRNRSARARGGVAEVALTGFVRDVGVGPGSAGTWRAVHEPPALLRPDASMLLQPLSRTRRHDRIESPRHYPDDDLVDDVRALVWLPRIAGHGVLPIPLGPSPADTAQTAVGPAHPVHTDGLRLHNGLVSVEADARGHVTLRFPSLALTLDDCLRFEDVGDAGDSYTPSLLGAARSALWCTGARLADRGPLRASIQLTFRMRVPAALEPSADGHSRRTRPTRGHVELPLAVTLSLDADAAFVRVHVRGDNTARDHRLRVAFGTGVEAPVVRADAAFGPVVRTAPDVPLEERAVELPPPTAPLHRWVSCDGDAHAATLVSDGLAEYEVRPGRVLVTLIRAVGELSRPDLPERPGNAGWPVPTPEAQCLGPFEATFALWAHPPWSDATADAIEALADDALLPLTGHTLRSAVRAPSAVAGVTLEGTGLAFGAMMPDDAPDGVVLRCINVTESAVDGAWRIAAPVTEAWSARLDGTPERPLPIEWEEGVAVVRLRVPARGVSTVLVRAASG
jgi:hypothetical protein